MATPRSDDRIFLVEATGLQGVVPAGQDTFKVPYRSLARTLHFIKRKGGKIVRIQSLVSSVLPPEPCQSSGSANAIEVKSIEPQHSLRSEAIFEKPIPVLELPQKQGLVMSWVEKLKSLLGDKPDGS